MSWSESVDEALCFGWIDGVRKSIDAQSYSIRFTPRKSGSIWSAVNIDKMGKLTAAGKMQPAGLATFAKRREEKSRIYAHESESKSLQPQWETQFKSNKKAWDFFTSQAPSYQKTALHVVLGAKQEATRLKRFEALVSDSENGLRIKQLRR